MNLQQLEYISAIAQHQHFAKAADACHVTQPTLSAMVHKLEEELGVKLFDRSRVPVVLTPAGEAIVAQARTVLAAVVRLRSLADEQQRDIRGELRLGIIPTVAPYLMPLFIPAFTRQYPGVRLIINELTTELLVSRLKQDLLDAAILATPLLDPQLSEEPLFREAFVVYAPHETELLAKAYVLPGDINPDHLVLLEEGHCVRAQVVNLCALQQAQRSGGAVAFEAGSLESLRRMVESHAGVTILPELALLALNDAQSAGVRRFRSPAPVREISLATFRPQHKRLLINALQAVILAHLPPALADNAAGEVVGIYR